MIRRTLFLLGALLAFGCNTPDPSATTEIAPPGDLKPFGPVEQAMGASCASLDCHGQPGRNLRLYDARGLRLDPMTLSGDGVTTPAEIDADERSVVALEPDLTNHVFKEKGAMPDRLTIVRKARGAEEHKGNAVWPEGSNGDQCLTSWLASNVNTDACDMTVTEFTAPQQ